MTTVLRRGTTPNYADDGPVRAISQASNQPGGLDWSRTRFHEHDGSTKKIKGILQPGDILINSTGRGTLGRVGYFSGGPDGKLCMADAHVTVARTDANRWDPRFAFYYLSSDLFYSYIYSALVIGATNQIELSGDRLASAPVILPPLDKQRHIAGFLDAELTRIDQVSSLFKESDWLAQERKQALRASTLEQLAQDHGEVPLRRFVTKIEQGESPQCESSRAGDSEWGVLKLSSIKDGTFSSDENKRLPEGIRPEPRFAVRTGDLLVTRANTPELVGDTAVVTDAYHRRLLPDLIYRVGLTDALLPEFAAITLRGPRVRGLIQAVARGSSQSMVKLRGEDIRAWPIPRAPVDVQRLVVSSLEEKFTQLAELRAKVSHQLSLLAERRQALITAAVTGQLDVTTAGRAGKVAASGV
ncbi:type I restriction enzyme S subunit [Spinactinospora alkalitolerans]|uniref:Type I restriction enzyme S subunit n=1 Tax=Spinactinospora alkalitolerans TaxID=687207 RepID=A0A852U2F3_9ACTN|nr:type I restriction enzyme S subunit [Spinactinospora alkalitolerans]